MDKLQLLTWRLFEKTGSIDAYLKFKEAENSKLGFEVGEEIGAYKDGGDSDEDS